MEINAGINQELKMQSTHKLYVVGVRSNNQWCFYEKTTLKKICFARVIYARALLQTNEDAEEAKFHFYQLAHDLSFGISKIPNKHNPFFGVLFEKEDFKIFEVEMILNRFGINFVVPDELRAVFEVCALMASEALNNKFCRM